MKNLKSIMWGIVLIVIGVIIGGNSLGLFDINIFFNGWWTLFIIIPSFIGIVTESEKTGSIIFFLIGISLLLGCIGLLDYSLVMKLILPATLIAIGLSIILKNIFNSSINNNIKEIGKKIDLKDGYTATFSGQNINLDNEVFRGTNLNAVFGGIKLDLRNAIIEEDIVINTSSIFGGIDIYVSDNFNIKIKSNSIFGGVSNNKKSKSQDGVHTIYINAKCVFGGVDIK